METALISNKGTTEILDFFGPTAQFLVPPEKTDSGYCVMQGSIPPGVSVPLHSHPEGESFYILSGAGQVYAPTADGFRWMDVKQGEMAHIPGGMKHAWRNLSNTPLDSVVTTSPALGRFFQEVGRPVKVGQSLPAPSAEELQRFVEVSKKYGQWLASPQENAAIGIGGF
jgi:quercetin dioxygenase-like cupin family protein